VLHAKLRRLAAWNDARRDAAVRYDALLADVPRVGRPATAPGNEHVWHLYVVRVDRRDDVRERLAADRIATGMHYPLPIHLQPAHRDLGHRRGDFPVAERLAENGLSLPMYPQLPACAAERVARALAGAAPRRPRTRARA
jgi:dTDP-4-amino-4,6-dideoxygalactose transaminase